MAVALDGTRDGVQEMDERAVRIQKGGDDEKAKKLIDEQPLLQRSVFPWMEVEGEKEAFVGDHFDTTTPYEVASHFGVPEVIFERFIEKEMQEAESCWGLPFTLLMVASYIGMMISHHDAATMFSLESSLVDQLEEKALFRYSDDNVGWRNLHQIDSYYDFYSWLQQGFLPLVMQNEIAAWETIEDINVDWTWEYTTTQFYSNTTSSTTTSTTSEETTTTATTTTTTSTTWLAKDPSYIPIFHRVVGGVRFQQERGSGGGCKGNKELEKAYGKSCVGGLLYELDPDPMGGRQTRDPQRITWFWVDSNSSTIENTVYDMEMDGWLDQEVQKVEIAVALYNGEYGVHSYITINFYFNRAGHIWKRIIPESIFAEQYPSHAAAVYVFDASWIACLVYIVATESREIFYIVRRTGFGWLFLAEYVTLWNMVDVLSLVYGVTIIFVAMAASRLTGRLNKKLEKIGELDGIWYSEEVDTFQTNCKDYMDYLEYLVFLSNRCRILFSCYPWVIALRLLKAFNAQPRLSLVTRTLFFAWEELLHLLFVIFFVYSAFIMSGMILFSSHMHDFATVSRAFFTAFRCMIGDIEWKSMLETGRWEAMLWFVSFQVVTFFCFLNIILVILMGAYQEVKESVSSADTLWDECYQSYDRWVGMRRGEMVPLLDIRNSVWDNRDSLKMLYEPDTNHNPIEDKLKPFLSEDGTIRVVTIEFLRNYVMKMRSTQARTLLEDSIMYYYSTNRTHSHIEQMTFLVHEMKHLYANMNTFMAGGEDSSDDSDIDVGDLDRRMADRIQEQKKMEIERRELFNDQLRSCKIDLHHAKLWVGTDILDEYAVKPKVERQVSSHVLNSQYAEGPSDDAIAQDEEAFHEELAKHKELESEIRQLEDQKALAKKIAAKAMTGIGKLEPQLLQVIEESAAATAKFQDLKRRVMELTAEQKRLDHGNAKGKKDMNISIRGRHDAFDLVHQLSNENEALTKQLQKVRQDRQQAAKHKEKEYGYMHQAKVHKEPQLDLIHEVIVEAAKIKSQFSARMLEHAEKAAQARGAGQVPEIFRLVTTIEEMIKAKKVDYVDAPPANNRRTGERTFVYLPQGVAEPDNPSKLPDGQNFKKLFIEYGGNVEMDEDITICSV